MISTRTKPDIRLITRMVPKDGNLVQGQSELAISPNLSAAAAEEIAASHNHYCPAEGVQTLRSALAEKISLFNGIQVNASADPRELLVTHGATGALVAIAQTYLRGSCALVFEPYYPYHRRIVEEMGGLTETLPLDPDTLSFNYVELRRTCQELAYRSEYPLRAIIVCTPVNPTGKVFTKDELDAIADICREFDLLCISDEVYEHYVAGPEPHISIATLPEMAERTLTVNSFSKSWNISGWRLGYVYGPATLTGPLLNVNNVSYVCSPTPLQNALASVLMTDENYYRELSVKFESKRAMAVESLSRNGFTIYDSGSCFYLWTKIPHGFSDAMDLNNLFIARAGVAGVPGCAFADSDLWDDWMRFCIAREDSVLESALGKIDEFFAKR